ncbi:hypothetical protein NQ318_004209 [Aromia moschata]|uniref:Major facilitator superfamily (MFS) profile domain-containing protein n=1 Tax=Aromia moschata TaxID=1265417 RepID=A0AAV8Y6K3_9CUCU|nr:hypothetical protein NQ318_004209 [Aromia moschata]
MISDESPNENVPTYPEWSDHKNVMLSAFFWGYVCTQLVGAFVAERFGPKWFLAVTVFITSLFSMLIPVFASEFGYKGVIACRVIQGLGQGLLFPMSATFTGQMGTAYKQVESIRDYIFGVEIIII